MKKLAYTNVNAEASMLKHLRSLEDVIPELLMSGLLIPRGEMRGARFDIMFRWVSCVTT